MDLYETRALIGTLADLRRPSRFLLNTYFRGYIGPTGKEKIAFDVGNRTNGMAMFCSPLVEGRPVRGRGYFTKEFTPAYVKPWMPFDPLAPLKRSIGEPLNGDLSPAQREAALIVQGFDDLYTMCMNRIEKMAGEALSTGMNIIVGDGYPTTQVDYGRAAGQTITLSGGSRWGQVGVSPVSDLESWIQTYIAANGYAPNIVTFTPDAWKLFRADPLYKDSIDTTYRRPGASAGDSLMFGDAVQGQLMGRLNSGNIVELWVYQQIFKDETGADQQALPNNTVILGASFDVAQQTQAYGTIVDPELGYESTLLRDPETGARMDVAPKTWTTPNPSRRFIMVQSAPLTALTNPNATMAATVN